MTKYEAGFKLKIVKQYLSGPLGLKALAAEHGVGHGTVRSWVNSYRAHGLPGLRRKSASYDEAFAEGTQADVARAVVTDADGGGIRHSCAAHIGKWARQYHAGGIDALRRLRTGRPKTMSNKPPQPQAPAADLDDKQIIARQNLELIELRAEVAYLKTRCLDPGKACGCAQKRKP